MAQSLTKSSASLVAAGGDLAEAAALTATANAIIQDADAVGTALKTTSLRLRGTDVKVLEEEGVDSDGAVTSKSKLQSKVQALSGVDILTETGDYKSTYQILSQIADVWEDISNMDQAALLELLAGKRNASVLAAILQSPEQLKTAYEDANNAAGSALEENEKYLDSIQGKIDQFNNAMQSMWSNTLDSDMVKGFVALGTEIIKIIDKIGLLNSALIAFAAYKGIGAIFSTFKDAGVSVDFITKQLGSYLFGINAVTAAEATLTQAQVARKLTQQGLTAEQAQAIAAQTGLATSTANLSRETLIASLQAQGYSDSEAEAIATKIFGTTVTEASTGALLQETIQRKLASSGLIQYAIQLKLATAEQVANMTITQLLSLSFSALVKAIGAATVALVKFLFTNPVGWFILAIGAIAGGVAIFNHFHKTTEELTEELNDLKSELQDIQTELEAVNSELETTEQRMAELLATDTLSFTEEEELKKLKKTNDELQRKIDLLDLEKKHKGNETANTFVDTMNSFSKDKYDWDATTHTFWETLWGAWQLAIGVNGNMSGETLDEFFEGNMDAYQSSWGDKDSIEKAMVKMIADLRKASEGIEYGISEESDAWLDYINNIEDKWAIVSGGANAKSNAITRIFNKEEYSEAGDALDGLVEKLKKNPNDASLIDQIREQLKLAKEDLDAVGIGVEGAIGYFTEFASNANYKTIEGKVKEVEEATKRLKTALSGDFDTSNLDQVKQALTDKGWVDTKGNLMSDVIAEYFGGEGGGISPETQAEIERLIQQIYDGKISVENALKQFEYFGIESTIDIYIAEVQTNFKDVFVELEEVDGLIDTFQELGEAIGSTADALKVFNKAEAEVANSGRVSIQTALELMEYTDDYGSVLEVVDGKLRLVDNAEEVLIQTRIDAIKTSAEASLSDATNAYHKAQLATQTYKDALTTDMSASVVAKSWEKVLAAGAGLWEGIKSLVTADSWTEAYNRGYNATLENITGYETVYDDTGLQALVDAEAEAKSAMEAAADRVKLANQLTPETLEAINDADDVDSVEDVAAKRFQAAMDYWENRISANQARYEQLQNEIDLLEAKGQKADASYYERQIKLENERLYLLQQQKAEAQRFLGTFAEGSDEWFRKKPA